MPVKKELDNGQTTTYKIKFIDSFRLTSSSLLSLLNNLAEGLHNYKCDDCDSYLYYIKKAKNNNKLYLNVLSVKGMIIKN